MKDTFYNIDEDLYENIISILYGYEEFYHYKNDEYKECYFFIENFIRSEEYNTHPFYPLIESWRLQLKDRGKIRYIQINITNECSLQCIHCCHQNKHYEKIQHMSLDNFKKIIEKFESVNSNFSSNKNNKLVTISGGECSLHPQFTEIVNYATEKFEKVKILTNLVNLSDEILDLYISLKEKLLIQVSIDGVKNTHNFIRGANVYDDTLANIKRLLNYGIEVSIMFVSNNLNYKEYETVFDTLYSMGVKDISCQRYVEQHNKKIRPLNDEELEVYFLQAERKHTKPRIPMFVSDFTYRCNIGQSFLVDCYGNLMVCRQIPKIICNVISSTVDEIVVSLKLSKIKHRLIPLECLSCDIASSCIGGSKCLVYAEKGNFYTKDSLCNIRRKYYE